MKLTLSLTFCLLLISQISLSQTSKENILIGGGFGFAAGNNSSTIQVVPSAHYFFADNFSVGARVGFANTRFGNTLITTNNSLSISPSARYYYNFAKNFFAYGEARVTYGFGGSNILDGNNSTSVDRFASIGYALRPGIMYTPYPRLGFDLSFNLYESTRITRTPAGSNTANINVFRNFGIDLITPSLSIYYIIKR